MFKVSLLGTVLLASAVGGAQAADLANVKPAFPAAVVAYTWSGAYVGAFGGAAFGRTRATDINGEDFGAPGSSISTSSSGGVAGITIGYNYQSGNWVFGPEIEIGFASNKKSYSFNNDNSRILTDYGFYGTAVGRLGYAFDRTLIYGKAGATLARIKSAAGEYDGVGQEDQNGEWGFDGNEAGWGEKTRIGWTIGAGIEHALTDHWSVKGEYGYADFGKKTYDGTQQESPFRFRDQLHTIKVGLNYKF